MVIEEPATVLLETYGTNRFAYSAGCFIDDLTKSDVLGHLTLIVKCEL